MLSHSISIFHFISRKIGKEKLISNPFSSRNIFLNPVLCFYTGSFLGHKLDIADYFDTGNKDENKSNYSQGKASLSLRETNSRNYCYQKHRRYDGQERDYGKNVSITMPGKTSHNEIIG
ncbi:hypothetical protein ES703_29909 [subsurface metagenome]